MSDYSDVKMTNLKKGPPQPAILVFMGVAGCGKSTLAARLAENWNYPFQEGDALHPLANIEKMANHIPLEDADRWPWLGKIRDVVLRWQAQNQGGIIACSALKKIYRDFLREGALPLYFIYLKGDRDLIGARMANRIGHYMPLSLLESQFATLEEPLEENNIVVLDAALPPEDLLARLEILFGALDSVSPTE